MNRQKGQSIIETIVMLGVLAFVLTGAVVLLLHSINARTRSFDRKKATELGVLVIEELVSQKNNSPEIFWNQTVNSSVTNQINQTYDGYTYTIDFITQQPSNNVCSGCVEAVVSVLWTRDIGMSTVNTRLFSRQ